MINIGLSHGQLSDLFSLLSSAHSISIRIRLLDLDGNYLQDLSKRLSDGQVTVDATQSTSRALDLTLIDPNKAIHLDPDSASPGSVYTNNQISIIYVVSAPDGSSVYNIPIFCGPINAVDRDQVTVSIKALGKESMGMFTLWKGKTYKKGAIKTNVIRNILVTLMGENKLSIIDRSAKLPKPQALSISSLPWNVAKRIANGISCQLFYDGRGVAVLRSKPTKSVFTFTESWLTSRPQVGLDLSTFFNAVHVVGGTPKGSKKAVEYRLVASKEHPLSPWRIGRGGVPQYRVLEVNDSSILNNKDAKTRAKKELDDALLESVNVTFDSVPNPLLQEMDIVRINTEDVVASFRLKQFIIPLTADGDSSVGYLKRVKPKSGKRPIKVRRKH